MYRVHHHEVDMKVVTGGLGAIGTPLVLKLIETDDVCIVDNRSTCSYDNYDLLRKCDRHGHELLIVEEDTRKLYELDVDFDQMYHLACPGSPSNYIKNPLMTLSICADGTARMIEICKRHKAKLLFVSSSAVYGDATINPQHEDYTGNIDIYDQRVGYQEGNRWAEIVLINSNIDYSIARLFTTYSKYTSYNDHRVLTEFINRAECNEPLFIHGTGSHTRSFMHVDDAIDGLLKLMESDYNKPVNLGNPYTDISILCLAHKVINLTNSKSRVIFDDAVLNDPIWSRPDITVAKNILNWEPRIDLDTGIKSIL